MDEGGALETVSDRVPLVSIVIVTYNSAENVADCLRSVAVETAVTHEVIVIDNASSDATLDVVGRHDVDVVESLGENLGFAAACNIGAALATGRHILFLNPDTVVMGDAVGLAARYLASHPEVGAVGATTLYENGEVNPTCCFAQPSIWGTITRAVGLSTLFPSSALLNPEEIGGWDRRDTREVGSITGCFLLLERALFSGLGGFDERFFMYSEDTDLSMRIQRSGRTCVHLHDAVVIHHGGGSDVIPAQKMVKVLRARAQLFRKHWSAPKAMFGVSLLDLTVGVRVLASCVSRRWVPGRVDSKWTEVWQQRKVWHKTSR